MTKNRRLIIDLETNGLLQEVTKIHCASVVDLDSSYSELFLENNIAEFISLISAPNVELIGHNIFCYDLKVLEKLCNWKPIKDQKIHDTMILGQLLYPDLKNMEDSDEFKGKIFSKRDTGSHSLRAWGQRCMCFKGEYTGGWEVYNDDMGRYAIQDVYTTKALFQFLESKVPDKLLSRQPIDLEYSIAPILARLQAHGVLYDKEKSDKLIIYLTSKLVETAYILRDIFKPRFVSLGEFIPKRSDKSKGYKAGCLFTKVKLEEFNPSSRPQIVDRLIKEYGWNPTEFTELGNVKMNEDIIENLPFKELAHLKEYLTIKKRISQIETGTQAWTKKVNADGRIRGAIRQNGTVTGRASHFSPNLAQVPANESLYGKECRELFRVPQNKVMVGCDADALEMRCIAGYLTPYDKGQFLETVLRGNKDEGTDAHTLNMLAYGITNRDCAKTLYYADVYGALNAKMGQILMEYGINFENYVEDFQDKVEDMVEWVNKKNSEDRAKGKKVTERSRMYWECWIAGKECRTRFGEQMPYLAALREAINERLDEVGYIKGLDGRKLTCRSRHGALNTVIQSAGALIMKKTIAIADNDLQTEGFRPVIDYEFILWVHDEIQVECLQDETKCAIIRNILEESIRKAGEFFGFPAPMKGNSQMGVDWSCTH